jgi:fatty acid/phospholipid biosynthesis enzyme
MPWRKFKAPFRYRVIPGSDAVVQFFEPGQVIMITTACETAAEAADVLEKERPEVTDDTRKAHTETVLGQDDKPKSAVRKAR